MTPREAGRSPVIRLRRLLAKHTKTRIPLMKRQAGHWHALVDGAWVRTTDLLRQKGETRLAGRVSG